MIKQQILILSLLILGFSSNAQNYNSFDELKEKIVSKTIPLISVEQLNKVKETKTDYLIIDARARAEFDVSHIKDSRHVGYNSFDVKVLDDVNKETIVVVYCSVGYRSEKVGEKLKKEGFKKVMNLEGGVFDWVNKGFFVYDGSGSKTQKVHVYDKLWGKWLTKGERVYE